MKNLAGIARWQKVFPDRRIADVAEDIGGGAQIFFEDGGAVRYPPRRREDDNRD